LLPSGKHRVDAALRLVANAIARHEPGGGIKALAGTEAAGRSRFGETDRPDGRAGTSAFVAKH
jgi:hypothetical protein